MRGHLDSTQQPPEWRVLEPADWIDEPLADAILAADTGDGSFWDSQMRGQVAAALRDRQLTASQRTGIPFVFRSGGSFRTGTRVQTVRDAVNHMDRYPADGTQVLRDGTLATWLEEEGAYHLAALAREVVQQPKPDMRSSLERFLQGTGLVARPQLAAAPATMQLGYVLQGQKSSRQLTIDRRGRGYLFGDVSGRDLWLGIEPRSFDGTPAQFVVTAETSGLKIAPEPYTSDVLLKCSASDEPVSIPVSLRVVAEPARYARLVVRPLAGLLLGAASWHTHRLAGER